MLKFRSYKKNVILAQVALTLNPVSQTNKYRYLPNKYESHHNEQKNGNKYVRQQTPSKNRGQIKEEYSYQNMKKIRK
jgi:hypothetical protein